MKSSTDKLVAKIMDITMSSFVIGCVTFFGGGALLAGPDSTQKELASSGILLTVVVVAWWVYRCVREKPL